MKRIHVMAAVIERGDDILIARRPNHLHQGGKWEFPGGKLEAGEAPLVGLDRELREELGISVEQAEPLIRIAHDYPDKSVLLDVWRVSAFHGEPNGREGQEIRWVARQALGDFEFPAANVPIVAAAQLPAVYVISPELETVETFLAGLEKVLIQGHQLVQIRPGEMTQVNWRELVGGLEALKQRFPVQLLLSSRVQWPSENVFDGVHLTSRDLMALKQRPVGVRWLAASCHSPEEVAQAERVGVDFITLSPVLPTASHPDADALGMETFADWVEAARLPVYGLGGLALGDLAQMRATGAQGVAGIRAFWD